MFETGLAKEGHYFCIIYCTEMRLPFYEFIQAMEGLGVCSATFLRYFESLSSGPTQGIIPILVHCMTFHMHKCSPKMTMI